MTRLAVLLTACALCVTGSVRAAPCGRPDIDAAFPPNLARNVPSNALLSAHYGAPARYDDEPVSLTDASGADVAVSVMFDEAASLLRAMPNAPLGAGHYAVEWPGLRGVSGEGGIGRGRSVGFDVTAQPDAASPSFSGLSGIDWELSRERDPCLDRLDDRFIFRLQIGEATDDTAPELLSLLIFETKDPAAASASAPTQIALRALPADGELEVRRAANHTGETCFAAVVQDLVGSVSGGGEREVCVKTKKPPFFEGCSFRPTRPASEMSALPAIWLLLAGCVGLRRRRGRRAPRQNALAT